MPKRSAKPKLGRLQKLDPTDYWQTQADFLQWLMEPETLELLGETVGLDLVLSETDAAPSPDCALLTVKGDEPVLLTAHLGSPTAADLGTLLAWAAAADAATVLWIGPAFAPEVCHTLDWLDQTSEVTWLGVVVELWSIGNAAMAANFIPTCGAVGEDPDDEGRDIAQGDEVAAEIPSPPEPEPLSELQQENLDFWSGLCDRLDRQGSLVKPGSPSIDVTMGFAIARAGFRLNAILDRDHNSLYTELLLSGIDAQPHFHLLAHDREAIADDIGLPLIWDGTGDQTCMVASTLTEVNLGDRNLWPTYQAWFCDCLERFYEAFFERIKQLDANSYEALPRHRAAALNDALILPARPRR
ncbi:DUF4268 domain-containing protein [Leptolyngbya sp. KIOST-1]|uniref:DUF4268 domain-containing protein n=1 Tax=Leptolyngbya sp. KIOST-1 TaxID=1229172 RepID=UPI00056A25C9|nr:DUF4268 domain-containing protein [Leptolyngbya sp. KIOST-1]